MITFPAFKIGLLLIRQIAKPIANYVKNQTKEHEVVRKFVISFAQGYHKLEIKLKRRQADVERPEPAILPLDDKRAIELAANFIGETIIFSAAALAVTAEYYRKKIDDIEKKTIEANKEIQLNEKISELENKILFFEKRIDELDKSYRNIFKGTLLGIFSSEK